MQLRQALAAIAALGAITCGQASATVLVEDFEAPFPAWQSGWFGANSNAVNFFPDPTSRLNNPDGLWISDGDGKIEDDDVVSIRFTPAFGAMLTSFSIDIATYVHGMRLEVYDGAGKRVLFQVVNPTFGASTDPGVYEGFSVANTHGISGFDLFRGGGQVEGNTSIDNLKVTLVPEPSSFALLGLGILGLGLARRRVRS